MKTYQEAIKNLVDEIEPVIEEGSTEAALGISSLAIDTIAFIYGKRPFDVAHELIEAIDIAKDGEPAVIRAEYRAAAKRFLVRQGWEIIGDASVFGSMFVAQEPDTKRIHFVRFDTKQMGDEWPEMPAREWFEDKALRFLRDADKTPDVSLVFDHMILCAVNDDRAMVRYHANCLEKDKA